MVEVSSNYQRLRIHSVPQGRLYPQLSTSLLLDQCLDRDPKGTYVIFAETSVPVVTMILYTTDFTVPTCMN